MNFQRAIGEEQLLQMMKLGLVHMCLCLEFGILQRRLEGMGSMLVPFATGAVSPGARVTQYCPGSGK